jgi:hypothetical protein
LLAVIPLPRPAPPVARTDPLALLGPDASGDIASHAPGPVTDDEVVRVGLAPDGSVASVRVDQRLTLTGVGDFDIKVLGPASDVEAPAGQSPQPGLRSNTVLWQGFSPGTKVLASTITLQPAFERDRLPVSVRVSGGQVVVANATAVPIKLATGTPDPVALRELVAGVRAKLAAGEAPVAGEGGLPAGLPSPSEVGFETRPVMAPVRVTGSVGGVPVDVLLPSAAAPDGRVAFPAASGEVRLTVVGALPEAAALAEGAGLLEVETVLAQAARLGDVQVYAGLTVPGPSSARFEFAPEAAAAVPQARPPEKRNPVAAALAGVAVLALLGGGWAVWRRS